MNNKMENNWVYVTFAIVAGVLAGLYIVGKLSRSRQGSNSGNSKIKVTGKDFEDLERKLQNINKKKNVVEFENLPSFSYESLAEWIHSVDLNDIDKETANYGCLIVRSSSELEQFNLDLSKLTDHQKEHIFGALIVNTENKKVFAQRWIICDSLDEDLLGIFGDDNFKILK